MQASEETVAARYLAMEIAAELKKTLGADEREDLGESQLAFRTPSGGAITLDILGARVIVQNQGWRLDVTVLPHRIAISYIGDYHSEAITAMYLLDFLHETGRMPTPRAMLSAAQLASLADLRVQIEDLDVAA